MDGETAKKSWARGKKSIRRLTPHNGCAAAKTIAEMQLSIHRLPSLDNVPVHPSGPHVSALADHLAKTTHIIPLGRCGTMTRGESWHMVSRRVLLLVSLFFMLLPLPLPGNRLSRAPGPHCLATTNLQSMHQQDGICLLRPPQPTARR